MKIRKSTIIPVLFVLAMIMSSCGPSSESSEGVAEVEMSEVIIEEDIWIIYEHQINDVALTSAASELSSGEEIKKVEVSDDVSNSDEEEEDDVTEVEVEEGVIVEETDADYTDGMNMVSVQNYQVYEYVTVSDQFGEAGYVELVEDISVEEAVIPLDETQTLISFGKKGDTKAVLQVTTDPEGNIEHIVFTDKKHSDAYDVSTGMTGKEVKKLRKELKHMVKNGQVFLYDDQSNVMYLMSAQDNLTGEEMTSAEIESLEVTALVWKDKKHHKKDKK